MDTFLLVAVIVTGLVTLSLAVVYVCARKRQQFFPRGFFWVAIGNITYLFATMLPFHARGAVILSAIGGLAYFIGLAVGIRDLIGLGDQSNKR